MMDYITYTDEHLEYWGDVYIREKKIIEYGIRFNLFLQIPHEILTAVKKHGFEPLLPKQRRVAARIRHEEAMKELQRLEDIRLEKLNAVRRDSGYIEQLHHHRYHRKAPRYIKHGETA